MITATDRAALPNGKTNRKEYSNKWQGTSLSQAIRNVVFLTKGFYLQTFSAQPAFFSPNKVWNSMLRVDKIFSKQTNQYLASFSSFHLEKEILAVLKTRLWYFSYRAFLCGVKMTIQNSKKMKYATKDKIMPPKNQEGTSWL